MSCIFSTLNVCIYVCLSVRTLGVAYLKVGDSCDLEIFSMGPLQNSGRAFFVILMLFFKRIKGIKILRQKLLNTNFRNIWEQTDEKKLYLWRDKSNGIKFASERSSQQGIKGLKLIPFDKNTILLCWGQSHEKKLYLIRWDDSNEIKFYSVKSSQQRLKWLKIIPFC